METTARLRFNVSLPLWILAVLGSLLINSFLWIGLDKLQQIQGSRYESASSLPVRAVTEDELKKLQEFNYENNARASVETSEAAPNEQAKADPFPAEYLGRKTQRVKIQTMARGPDIHMGQSAAQEAQLEAKQQEVVRKLFADDPNAVPIFPTPSPKIVTAPIKHRMSFSIDDLGKNVEMGVETLLNTDEYKYYTFVTRIKEGVYPIWRKNLDFYGRQATAVEGQYLTRGTLVMDEEGEIKKIEDWVPSGVMGFDRSVQEAFQELGRVPNPPTEMVEDDHLVRLKFSFRVDIDHSLSPFELPRGAAAR